jgi:hypothetical protein
MTPNSDNCYEQTVDRSKDPTEHLSGLAPHYLHLSEANVFLLIRRGLRWSVF